MQYGVGCTLHHPGDFFGIVYIMGSKQPQQTVQQIRAHLHSITSKNPVINNLDLAEADVVRTAVPAPFRKHHVKRLEFRRWC